MSNEKLTGAQKDTLIALVERGPLDDGDVPSKSGRNDLIGMGLAARAIVHGQDGFTVATYAGRDAYCALFGEDYMREAMAKRKANNAISHAKWQAEQ